MRVLCDVRQEGQWPALLCDFLGKMHYLSGPRILCYSLGIKPRPCPQGDLGFFFFFPITKLPSALASGEGEEGLLPQDPLPAPVEAGLG